MRSRSKPPSITPSSCPKRDRHANTLIARLSMRYAGVKAVSSPMKFRISNLKRREFPVSECMTSALSIELDKPLACEKIFLSPHHGNPSEYEDWQLLILETGLSESEAPLRADAYWWFTIPTIKSTCLYFWRINTGFKSSIPGRGTYSPFRYGLLECSIGKVTVLSKLVYVN